MAVLKPELVGKTYGPETLRVTAEATIRYALATNDENPRYLDPSRPGGVVAPPLFAVVPVFGFNQALQSDPELAIPAERVLHGEHEIFFSDVIRPDDELTMLARIDSIDRRSTGETLTLEILTTTTDGAARNRQLLTLFVRDPDARGGAPRPAPSVEDRGEPASVATMKVSADQPLRYAEASGDHNPPHVDEGFATAIGFKTVILQGLCTMAFSSKAVVDELAARDPARLSHLKVRFSRVVYPGDVLTTRIWNGDGGVFTFETANQDEDLVLKGGEAHLRP